MRRQRGITFITVLVTLAAFGAIFWAVTYGPAYWDNFEVSRLVREAANLGYRELDDEKIRTVLIARLHQTFDEEVEDHGRTVKQMKFDVDREDVRVERSQVPHVINVWFTYSRIIKVPLLGGERQVTFTDHAEQDLTPVKW
jgi:hypothetical protein